MARDREYTVSRTSDQAEASTLNPIAARTDMRILVELQVISHILLSGQRSTPEDIQRLRESIAAAIT